MIKPRKIWFFASPSRMIKLSNLTCTKLKEYIPSISWIITNQDKIVQRKKEKKVNVRRVDKIIMVYFP